MRHFAVLAALLFSWNLHATEPPATTPAAAPVELQAKDLLEAGRFMDVAISIPQSIVLGAEMQAQNKDPAFRAMIKDVVFKNISPQKIFQRAESTLKKEMTGSEIKELHTWYTSPLGKRIVEMDVAAMNAKPEQIQAYVQTLQANPPSPERIALLEFMMKITKSVDLAWEAAITTAASMTEGMSSTMPPEKRVNADQVRDQMMSQMNQIMPQLQQSVAVMLHYSYRELSDAELKAYNEALKTAASRKYYELAMGSLIDEMTVATKNMGTDMGRQLASLKKKVEVAPPPARP